MVKIDVFFGNVLVPFILKHPVIKDYATMHVLLYLALLYIVLLQSAFNIA